MFQFIFFLTLLFLLTYVSARCKSREGFGNYAQYHAYVDVNNASIFYWFFEAFTTDTPSHSVPLIIVPGAPGQSATGSIAVAESGPFDELGRPRTKTMCQDYHMLYIDALPGMGFSKINPYNDFHSDNFQIAENLIQVLFQFFKAKPNLILSPTYIYAQSYGAQSGVKFILSLREAIANKNIYCNLKGIFLISPWISPIHLIKSWPVYLRVMGYTDKNVKVKLDSTVDEIQTYMRKGNSTDVLLLKSLEEDITRYLYDNFNFCNILTKECDYVKSLASVKYRFKVVYPNLMVKCAHKPRLSRMMNTNVKPKLSCVNKSKTFFDRNKEAVLAKVDRHLLSSGISDVEKLVKTDLVVVVVTSQFDLITNSLGTQNWIDSMHWSGSDSWKSVPKVAFTLNKKYLNSSCRDKVIGFRKNLGSFNLISLLRVGHLPYRDSPESVLTVIDNIVNSR